MISWAVETIFIFLLSKLDQELEKEHWKEARRTRKLLKLIESALHFKKYLPIKWKDFLSGSDSKEPACSEGDLG